MTHFKASISTGSDLERYRVLYSSQTTYFNHAYEVFHSQLRRIDRLYPIREVEEMLMEKGASDTRTAIS
jgi:hypothetical protein